MLEGSIKELETFAVITSEAEYKTALATVEPILRTEPIVGSPEYLHAMALVKSIDAMKRRMAGISRSPRKTTLPNFVAINQLLRLVRRPQPNSPYISLFKPTDAIDEIKMIAVSTLTDFSFDWHDLLFTPAAS